MNRVRLGLTGLALVFVMVLLVAALFGPFTSPPSGEGNNETLATLGVAPGGEEAKEPAVPPTPTPQPGIDEQFKQDPLPGVPEVVEQPDMTEGDLTEI